MELPEEHLTGHSLLRAGDFTLVITATAIICPNPEYGITQQLFHPDPRVHKARQTPRLIAFDSSMADVRREVLTKDTDVLDGPCMTKT